MNDIYAPINFPESMNHPILAHRFCIPELQAHDKSKHWSDYVLQKCREFLVNETCQIHIKGSYSNKIVPCSIRPISSKSDLVAYIKKNQLHYGELVDEKGDIKLIV